MCFSAEASFGASAILGVIGIASIKKASTPSQKMFASIPLIFAIQQFTEGFVWLSLTKPYLSSLQSVSINIFLIIAQILWPIWVPLSFALLEKVATRQKPLYLLAVMGAFTGLYHLVCFLIYPSSANITPYHIHYDLDFPIKNFTFFVSLYISSIILPPFISSLPKAKYLGIFSFISFLVSVFFFRDNIVSIWCFFAAIISWIVYVVMDEINNNATFQRLDSV